MRRDEYAHRFDDYFLGGFAARADARGDFDRPRLQATDLTVDFCREEVEPALITPEFRITARASNSTRAPGSGEYEPKNQTWKIEL
jgi:hypothetical protein